MKLLSRLYDPVEGTILLDGKDIREYDLAQYRRLFAVIFQDFTHYWLTRERTWVSGMCEG